MIISTTVMLALAVGFAQDATNSNGQATPPTETTTSAESVSARSEDRVTEAMRRLRDSDLTQNTPSKVLWQKLVETTATMLAVRREVAQAMAFDADRPAAPSAAIWSTSPRTGSAS